MKVLMYYLSYEKMIVFPYRESTSGDFFPIVNFNLHYKGNVINTSALIDSGATISIFREEVAEELGLEIEKGKETYLGGIGGRIKGYIQVLKVEIAGKEFSCPVVFSREYLVSFNLLGRDSFFPKFKITFEEAKQNVQLD